MAYPKCEDDIVLRYLELDLEWVAEYVPAHICGYGRTPQAASQALLAVLRFRMSELDAYIQSLADGRAKPPTELDAYRRKRMQPHLSRAGRAVARGPAGARGS
jgi:hypothetical protein